MHMRSAIGSMFFSQIRGFNLLFICKADLAQLPKRLCLYLYGIMGEERRNKRNG